MIMTHLTHYLLMDAHSIYEMPPISRCLVLLVKLSVFASKRYALPPCISSAPLDGGR